MLSKDFKKYFWDCDFQNLKWDNHKTFISERILNFGDIESVKWLKNRLSKEELFYIICNSKNIDAKTKNYWKIILEK